MLSKEAKAALNAADTYEEAQEDAKVYAEQLFMLYSNLMVEEASLPWNKIIQEQIDTSPWTDVYGKTHHKKHIKSWHSFMDCVTFHLLTMFMNDVAETQPCYICNGCKKPTRVPIRQPILQLQPTALPVLQPADYKVHQDS